MLPPGQPGRRFQDHHQTGAHLRRPARAALSIAGGTLVLAGLVTYPIPGPPSTLMVILGSALLGKASGRAARALDAIEAKLRRRRASGTDEG